ncbi:MAG TPA: glycosyltransferase family 1 protein [Patescibacteria group bacterium]|nr:glycosyltransferase family 1 protein [Patescibacteria group bacterium]
MKIGIDISQIIYNTGVSFYTRNLVRALAKIDKKNQYLLFGGSLRQKEPLEKFSQEIREINKNFSSKIITFPPTLAEPLFNRFHCLPIEKLIGPIDVFHTSDWTEPAAQAAKVTTIHDLTFLKNGKEVDSRVLKAHQRRLRWVKKESDLVMAVSQTTKKDIIKILDIEPNRIRVTYEAAPAKVARIKDEKKIAKTKREYGIKGDYLLVISPWQPRKNFRRILQAFRELEDLNLNLVVVGYTEMRPWFKDQKIIFTDYVSAGEKMNALFSGASCLVYPSLYEGFGLPILEAFTCGCPVVTANLSSMPEVAGRAAILVNPRSVKAIAQGIREALEKRDQLIKAGLKRVKQFSWQKTAQETLKVYEEAYRKHQTQRP